MLEILKPHIFFDDQMSHLEGTRSLVPSVQSPFGIKNLYNTQPVTQWSHRVWSERSPRGCTVRHRCLDCWWRQHVADLDPAGGRAPMRRVATKRPIQNDNTLQCLSEVETFRLFHGTDAQGLRAISEEGFRSPDLDALVTNISERWSLTRADLLPHDSFELSAPRRRPGIRHPQFQCTPPCTPPGPARWNEGSTRRPTRCCSENPSQRMTSRNERG